MTTLKVTEYVPAYNYMEEIHVEYDFTNHRYRVDNSNWKQMTTEYELRIKKQYKVNWKWGNKDDNNRFNNRTKETDFNKRF